MLHSPEGIFKHKDITNASLTIAGEPVFVYGCVSLMIDLCTLLIVIGWEYLF